MIPPDSACECLPGKPLFCCTDPAVELLRWVTGQDGASIGPTASGYTELAEVPEASRLDERALSIQTNPLGSNTATVTLKFVQGQLYLIANSSQGIATHYWDPDPAPNQSHLRVERYSYGEMVTLLYVERRYDEHWRDDRIREPNEGLVAVNDVTPPTRKISGADASEVRPGYAYLASNQARIYRIDMDDQGAKQRYRHLWEVWSTTSWQSLIRISPMSHSGMPCSAPSRTASSTS